MDTKTILDKLGDAMVELDELIYELGYTEFRRGRRAGLGQAINIVQEVHDKLKGKWTQ